MSVRPRGPLPDWRPTTPKQKAVLADLIARYKQHEREDTLPRGPRGIFYDLRPNGMGNGLGMPASASRGHTILERELVRQRVALGDRIRITFCGRRQTRDGAREYRRYSVQVLARAASVRRVA
jgi:hypothetical protein